MVFEINETIRLYFQTLREDPKRKNVDFAIFSQLKQRHIISDRKLVAIDI